tara:strand:- start:9372 stop:10610 length:1239 start_codon:yes stop_codon:yes gene_type:complete
MNKILFISEYSTYPENGFPLRSYFFANEISKENKVCLCFGSFHHRLSAETHQKSNLYYKKNFSILSLKLFKSRQPSNFLPRFINWFIFALKIFFIKKDDIGFIPNVIIYSSPTLVGFLGAYALSKRFNCKIYFEVRDIWPLSLHDILNVSKKNPIYILLQLIEDFAYKRASGVISSLRRLPVHIDKRIGNIKKDFLFLPNPLDIANLSELKLTKLHSKDTNVLNHIISLQNNGKKIVAYVGGIGPSNALDIFIKTASECEDKKVFWIIVGDGPDKNNLREKCKNLDLKNIIFFEKVYPNSVHHILDKVDLLFLSNNFKEIYTYGISPIKLPEYLYSGTPIIHVTNSHSPLIDADCWSIVNSLETSEILKKVHKLLELDNKSLRMGSIKAKDYVDKELSLERLTKKLITYLNK